MRRLEPTFLIGLLTDFLSASEYDVSLVVLDYNTTVVEPFSGNNATVDICFMAQLDSPLDRDSIFDISPSPTTTATLGDDYLFNSPTPTLTIPRGFSGTFSTCISIVILGDREDEDLETISYEVTARSLFDRVIFPLDANFSVIVVNILDAGKDQKICIYYRSQELSQLHCKRGDFTKFSSIPE